MNLSVEMLMPLEQHPYNNKYEIPDDTRLLIVGTAPPPRFSLPRPPFGVFDELRDADFFYGSEHNLLWDYLKLAAGEPKLATPGSDAVLLEDTEKLMCNYLHRHRIWMKDVLQTYSRKVGKADSPFDSDINIADSRTTFLDFSAVLSVGGEIERVVFTSDKAADWFFGKVLSNSFDEDEAKAYRNLFIAAKKGRHPKEQDEAYTKEFCRAEFDGRTIRFHIAPSPSGSAGASDDEWFVDIYRRILFERE